MKINICLKSRTLSGGEKRVLYGVTCAGEPQKYIPTTLSVNKEYWDNKRKEVSDNHSNWDIINKALAEMQKKAKDTVRRYDLGTLTYMGVINKLKGRNDSSSIDDFVETFVKSEMKDVTYKSYKNGLSAFKSALGIKRKLKFSDIDNSLMQKFHRLGNKNIEQEKWSKKTATEYAQRIRTLCEFAFDEDAIPEKISFKNKHKKFNQSFKRGGENYAPRGKEIYGLIKNIDNIKQWQSVALWLLCFSMRGLYQSDIIRLNDDLLLDKNLNSLENKFIEDNAYLDYGRSKNNMPMFIRLYPVILSLIRRLKYSVIYTQYGRKIDGREITTGIENRINIFNYNASENTDSHKELWRTFGDNFKKLGNKKITLKTARKSFFQHAEQLFDYSTAQKLTGQKLKGVGSEFYSNYKSKEQIYKIDEQHFQILYKFGFTHLYNILINKLEELIERDTRAKTKTAPKWLLMNGGIHKVGNKYKMLTGKNNKAVHIDIDSKFIKYFKAPKKVDVELDKKQKFIDNLAKLNVSEILLKSLQKDMKDLEKSRSVRSIRDYDSLVATK